MAMCAGTDNSGQNVNPGHVCHLKQILEKSISIMKTHSPYTKMSYSFAFPHVE